MQRFLIGVALATAALYAAALPSVAQVEAAVKQGDYAQAQVMMHDVVEAKPGSAKAQYLYAQILAHNGRFADASTHTAKARELDPALNFTAPDKFKGFEQMLEREQQHERRSSAGAVKPAPSAWQPAAAMAPRSGVPTWVWGAGLGLFALFAWRMLQRGNPGQSVIPPAHYGGQPAYGAAGPYAPSPGYGAMGGAAPSTGTGLMGVGLAAAGGVAAGMLADRLLQQGHHQQALGGGVLEPGYFSGGDQRIDPDAQALENRELDFGRGDDWGGGGGSVDTGGSDGGGW
jgi:tetratricopeptide (TPR) repeat protein